MKDPIKSHSNLSDAINHNLAKSEILGGVWLDQPTGEAVKHEPFLPVGKGLKIQTQNTLYTLEKRTDGTYIKGHAEFCPEFVKCNIHGSTWGGSMLKLKWIGRGMNMEFSIPSNPAVTRSLLSSPVKDITEFDLVQ